MLMQRLRPTLSAEFTARARTFAPDVASSIFLFISASFMAGRVWRLPFDDEVYTLSLYERYSAFQLLVVYPGVTDVHPPLSYLLFYGLQHLGLSDAAMRLCSLAMTAISLALFHLLALYVIAQRTREQSWFRKSAQDDKWSFCLTVGTLCPANQERP